MWNFIYSEVWWMDALITALLSATAVVAASIITTITTEKKAHKELHGDHSKMGTEHEGLKNGQNLINTKIDNAHQGLSKEVTTVGEKVTSINEKVSAMDVAFKLQEQVQRIAHDSMNKDQIKIMESIEYIKNLGKELEYLSAQNAEIKQENAEIKQHNQQLQAQLTENQLKMQSEINELKTQKLNMQKETEQLKQQNAYLLGHFGSYQNEQEDQNEQKY